jgi:hypothetical protein
MRSGVALRSKRRYQVVIAYALSLEVNEVLAPALIA